MNWREALAAMFYPYLASDRIGLISDMDGTISPIVDNPDHAQVTHRSRELLRTLNGYLELIAIVSGRSAQDIRQRVDLPDLVYVGNHGLERWKHGDVSLVPEVESYRPALHAAFEILRARLLPDMTIEDKGATLSIHYRQTADPHIAAAQFRPDVESVAREKGLRVFEGRMIFELRPPIDINKGTAFHSLVKEYNLDMAIYIGDDTTDVDALLMAQKLRESRQCYSIGLGVQSSDMPRSVANAADCMVSGVSDVEDFLEWLLKARRASST